VYFRLRKNDKFPYLKWWRVKKLKFFSKYRNLSFLCRAEYKLFCFDNLQYYRIHYYKHLGLFLDFFETSKCQILKKKIKKGLHRARPPNRFSACEWGKLPGENRLSPSNLPPDIFILNLPSTKNSRIWLFPKTKIFTLAHYNFPTRGTRNKLIKWGYRWWILTKEDIPRVCEMFIPRIGKFTRITLLFTVS
jgi:hypothetical protein